jgi:hypothetical protein
MSKPTSSTRTDQKASHQPRRLKVYSYGNLNFTLHEGGLPTRHFDIQWDKVSTTPGPESPQEPNTGYGHG